MHNGMHAIRAMVNRIRFERLEAQVTELTRLKKDVANEAQARLDRGQPLSRAQAAAFIGISTKKVQRMESQGKLRRCPDLGGVVLYPARDVLRLASAR